MKIIKMKNSLHVFSLVLLFVLCSVNGCALVNYAVGDYVQDVSVTENPSDLYNSSKGLYFDGSNLWDRGDFTLFEWSGDYLTRTEAYILLDGTYTNAHSFSCYRSSSLTGLQDPSHDMQEQIVVDSSKMSYYEPGTPSNCSSTLKLNILKDALSYKVITDYIPLKRIVKASNCTGAGCYLDFEYRGQMLFMGQNYFVRDINGDLIYLDRGQVITATNAGFSSDYLGYSFRVKQIMYITTNASCGTSAEIYVRKPDGSLIEVAAGCGVNGEVDNLEIAILSGQINGPLQTASIIVYDTSSEIVLEDGEDLEMGGQVWTDWEVILETVDTCMDDAGCVGYIPEYDEMDPNSVSSLLKSVTVVYRHDLDGAEALEVNESLAWPNGFQLRFKGYSYDNFRPATCPVTGPVYSTYFIGTVEGESCSMAGDNPPCGEVSLSEVVALINEWSQGNASLSDVIALINEWASAA